MINHWAYKKKIIYLIEKVLNDPDLTTFVSFPRSGIHWLATVLELYSNMVIWSPSFMSNKDQIKGDYTLALHTHDYEHSIKRKNVIYLYRKHIIDSIHSCMTLFFKNHKDRNDRNNINKWIDRYCRHLQYWLVEETYTKNKTIITYEDLKSDFLRTMRAVCISLALEWNQAKAEECFHKVDREYITLSTQRSSIPNKDYNIYENANILFRKNHAEYIRNEAINKIPELINNKLVLID